MAINPTNSNNNFILGTPVDQIGDNSNLGLLNIAFAFSQNEVHLRENPLFKMARNQMDLGQHSVAINILKPYASKIETLLDYPEIEMLYIEALIGDQRDGLALDRLSRFLNTYPRDIEAKSFLLKIYNRQGRKEEAENLSREILTSNPLNLAALETLCLFYVKEGSRLHCFNSRGLLLLESKRVKK